MKRLIWSSHPDSSPGSRIVNLTALWVLSCLVGSLALHGRTVHAQQAEQLVAVVHGMQSQNKEGPARNQQLQQVLAMPLAIDLNDVALSVALDEVAKRSGMRITYSRAVVPFERRVTVRRERVTLGDALNVILDGTNAMPALTPDRQIVIMRSPKPAATGNGTIAGRVIHAKTKQPVAGVTIMVANGSAKVITGNDGRFQLSVPAGNEKIHVRAVGFVRQTKDVTVAADATVTLEVVLEPSASVLDEVVVTGTVVATERKAIPTPITVITADDIEKRGITRVEQLLRGEVPGIVSVDQGDRMYSSTTLGGSAKSYIYSRGTANVGGGRPSTSPIKTYIDGVELLDPSYLGVLDPQTIERIEILTGPQAATVYGSGAIGGVMQIFTKQGRGRGTPELTVRAKYGMLQNNFSRGLTPVHNDAVNITGGIGSDFTYAANVTYNYTGQWQPLLFNRTSGASVGVTHTYGPVRTSGSVSTTFGTNGTYNFSPYSRSRTETGVNASSQGIIRALSQILSRSSSQTSSFNLDYQTSRLWQHHLTAGRSQTSFELDPVKPSYTTIRDTLYSVQNSSGQRTTLGYNTTVLAPHMRYLSSTLTLGATGSWAKQTQVSGCLPMESATSYIGCFAGGAPSVSQPIDDRSWGGFGQLQVGVFEQLYLTFGLRGERNPSYGEAHRVDWTPTNGVTYTAELGDVTLKLLASYGRATRAPNPMRRVEVVSITPGYDPERYVSQWANPHLTPEYSRGPQGGFELYYGNLLSLTVNRYTQKITDVVYSIYVDSVRRVRIADGDTSYAQVRQYINTAAIRQFGWEGTASLSVGPVSLKGTMSWADSRTIAMDPRTTYLGGTWYLPFVDVAPSRYGNVTISYAHGSTSLTLVSNIMGQTLAQPHNNGIYHDINGSERFFAYSRRARSVTADYRDNKAVTRSVVSGYVKSDLLVSHRISPWVQITASMVNVANTYRADIVADAASIGRQSLLGVSLTFPRR